MTTKFFLNTFWDWNLTKKKCVQNNFAEYLIEKLVVLALLYKIMFIKDIKKRDFKRMLNSSNLAFSSANRL